MRRHPRFASRLAIYCGLFPADRGAHPDSHADCHPVSSGFSNFRERVIFNVYSHSNRKAISSGALRDPAAPRDGSADGNADSNANRASDQHTVSAVTHPASAAAQSDSATTHIDFDTSANANRTARGLVICMQLPIEYVSCIKF